MCEKFVAEVDMAVKFYNTVSCWGLFLMLLCQNPKQTGRKQYGDLPFLNLIVILKERFEKVGVPRDFNNAR